MIVVLSGELMPENTIFVTQGQIPMIVFYLVEQKYVNIISLQ